MWAVGCTERYDAESAHTSVLTAEPRAPTEGDTVMPDAPS